MSEKKARTPRSFKLEDTNGRDTKAKRQKAGSSKSPRGRKPKADILVEAVADEAAQRVDLPSTTRDVVDQLTPPPPAMRRKSRFGWTRVLLLSITGLFSLALGLWVDQLIRDLFSRQDWLGWLAVGLSVLVALAALAIAAREITGIRRMARVDSLRARAAAAVLADDSKIAKAIIDELNDLYADRPDTATARSSLKAHASEIIDGSDLLMLAERDLMRTLDSKARALVMGSAKRVSIVTAVSPRALVDVGFVLIENLRLIRGLADLYGGRPGTLGFWRLARNVVSHLAVTGSIAIGEGAMQQLLGQGLAARISTRLGEGVVNGLLTARIGIAAIDVCRPLPFTDQTRPTVKDFMGELLSSSVRDPKDTDRQ